MSDPSSDRLDPDAAGAVIRRATELDQERVAAGEGGLDRNALAEAADEVGISPDAVRRALAEHDAGALAPTDPSRSLLGPARVRATRDYAVSAEAARKVVHKWLRGQLLEVHRRAGNEIEWRRRGDLGAKVRRKVDPTKRVRLQNVDGVVSSVVGVAPTRCIVRLEADLSVTRDGLRTGVIGVPAASGPILGGAAALVLAEPLIFLAGFPVGVALGGTGLFLARRTLDHELEEAQRVLELFLDEIGGRPR